jgi:hypothetical protein
MTENAAPKTAKIKGWVIVSLRTGKPVDGCTLFPTQESALATRNGGLYRPRRMYVTRQATLIVRKAVR